VDNIILNFLTSRLAWGAIIGLCAIKKSVYFVPKNRGFVAYTMVKYSQTLPAGVNFIIPFIQTVTADGNLKEQSLIITSQSAITRDNISNTVAQAIAVSSSLKVSI
jgi:regulator of protease activity HflC (stomatin/prohibitin superfamily)